MAENPTTIAEQPLATVWDSPLRWIVRSASHPNKQAYLVDLATGECQCRWHVTTVAPALLRHREVRRCRHWQAARAAFTDYMIAKLAPLYPESGKVPYKGDNHHEAQNQT